MSWRSKRLALVVLLALLASRLPVRAEDAGPAKYPFDLPPAKAIKNLSNLPAELGSASVPSDLELRLVEKAHLGQPLNQAELTDALLLASGATDEAELKNLRAQLDKLTAAARKAVSKYDTPVEQGDALLTFLHREAMSAGYESHLTELSTLLTTKKYNCASATVLYSLISARLGLETRALEFSSTFGAGHMMAEFKHGDAYIDVECTRADGFDGRRKIKDAGASVVGYEFDPKNGRPLSLRELPAAIYYNRGVLSNDNKADALHYYLAALAFDPGNESAIHNLEKILTDAVHDLNAAGQLAAGLKVGEFCIQTQRKGLYLPKNHEYICVQYARSLVQEGRDAGAMAFLEQAEAVNPEGRFPQERYEMFVTMSREPAHQADWRAALAILDRGLNVADEKTAEALSDAKAELYIEWCETEREAGRFDAAIEILVEAQQALPGLHKPKGHLSYFTQELLKATDAKHGAAAAGKMLAQLRERFPAQVWEINNRGYDHVMHRLYDLTGEEQYDQALAAAANYEPLLSGDETVTKLKAVVYDRWASKAIDGGDREKGIEIYLQGLKALPGEEDLTNNLLFNFDSMANALEEAGQLAEVVQVYERAAGLLPGNKHVQEQLEYFRQKLANQGG